MKIDRRGCLAINRRVEAQERANDPPVKIIVGLESDLHR